MGNRLAVALLAAGLCWGACLIGARAAAKVTISHDEGVSLLAATGHQGRFVTAGPVGRWVPSAAWKLHWTPDRFGRFRQIGHDLAFHDLHPPLYFWLLHVWLFLVGPSAGVGPQLNLILAMMATLVIFAAGRLQRCAPLASAVTALMWLLGSATLMASGQARHYVLLALVVACFAASMLRFLERSRSGAAWPLVLAMVAGMLVHYLFLVPLAVGLLFGAVLLFLARRRSSVLVLLGAAAIAVVGFVSLHPSFLESFGALPDKQPGPFSLDVAVERMTTTVRALGVLVLPGALANAISRWGAPVWIAVFAGLGAAVIARQRIRAEDPPERLGHTWLVLLAISGLFAVVSLYVLQRVPRWAMGPPYLMVVSPLLFMAATPVVDRVIRERRWGLALCVALVAGQAIHGGISTLHIAQQAAQERRSGYVDHGQPIVLDSIDPGVLPTALWHARGDTRVYAARQDDLLERFPELPAGLDTVSYISDSRYGNSPEKRTRLLERFAGLGYTPRGSAGSVFGVGKVYELVRESRVR